ncbi:MAG: FtsQ-type POTRA domain-containing protein, partial [Candidatus Atribacteria bacterium]|nr:FtsQ-type POTRA domain-containing protein [Candidatus Atribacteria bacterium]
NEILKKSEIKIGENIFLLNLKKSVGLLKGDPWIREVEIKKIIPDKIKIIIKERKVSAIVKIGEEYWESSKEGIILCLSDSEENTTGLPLITGLNSKNIKFGEKILEPEYRTALEIIHCMEVILPKKFCGVDIIDSDDFLIYNQDGSIKVRVNKAEEIINKENLLRETLKKIMEEKLLIDYIDLRFKDSLVIKVKK